MKIPPFWQNEAKQQPPFWQNEAKSNPSIADQAVQFFRSVDAKREPQEFNGEEEGRRDGQDGENLSYRFQNSVHGRPSAAILATWGKSKVVAVAGSPLKQIGLSRRVPQT